MSMGISMITPKPMVRSLSINSKVNAITRSMIRMIAAVLLDIVPLAMGRDLVRATFLSISRSIISLMTQPALRIKKAPAIKISNK